MENMPNRLNPKQAMERLLAGNQRFIGGLRSVDSLLAHKKMPTLAAQGQNPFAVVLTCSDSRSPAEIIFDQGLGDLFVVRVAGNIIAPSLLASIEFAVVNLGCSAVVVIGHTQCGAISAAVEHAHNPDEPLPSHNLEELINRIKPAVEKTERHSSPSKTHFMEKVTIANINQSVLMISEQSPIIRNFIAEGKVSVEGALLTLSTGEVNLV